MQSANPEEKGGKKKSNQNLYPQERKKSGDTPIPQNYDKLLIQTVSSIEHMGW